MVQLTTNRDFIGELIARDKLDVASVTAGSYCADPSD